MPGEAGILNLLARLRRGTRLTASLISHDPGVVSHLCARFAVMQQGRLVEVRGETRLRRGEVRAGYTRELIAASEGFTRGAG